MSYKKLEKYLKKNFTHPTIEYTEIGTKDEPIFRMDIYLVFGGECPKGEAKP